jgi:amino acid transporter
MAVITTFLDIELNAFVVSMSVLSLVVIINILGVKKIKAIQAPIVGFSIILLLVLSIKVVFTGEADLSIPAEAAFSADAWLLGETAALVFVAYAGVTKVAAIAGEIKDPGKNLPNGMFISLFTATLLYSGVAYILMATLGDNWWMVDGHVVEDPIYIFAEQVGGKTIGLIAAVLAILTMASMALAGILASSRYLFAMARDNLLPQAIEDVNAKWETPHWAIIITGAMMAFVLVTLPVKDVAKLASGFQIMVFIIVNICLVVLRGVKKGHEWYQPTYNAPLFPYVQIWGVLGGILLVIIMGEKAFIGAGVAIIIGLMIYMSYGKKHAHPRETPFDTFKQEFLNPTPAEHQRRLDIFHAADYGGKNHLTLKEFQHAISTLGLSYTSDELRLIFHKADLDENGVIDIDEFITLFETFTEEE